MQSGGVVNVRPFAPEDLGPLAAFCDAARALDPEIEPFAQRLLVIANGTRAALHLWRVAESEDRRLQGVAFAALREEGLFDFYAAVHPQLRRQGLGRALCAASFASGVRLRARVRDGAAPGLGFLRQAGFAQTGVQLSLQWKERALDAHSLPALRIQPATPNDAAAITRLSAQAWVGAQSGFSTRPDEIAQLFGDERVLLLAQSEGRPLGYLAGVKLGRTLGIEEVAVLPEARRMGIGRALVVRALRDARGAVLSVLESNAAGRALYRSLGFAQTARRLILEKP